MWLVSIFLTFAAQTSAQQPPLQPLASIIVAHTGNTPLVDFTLTVGTTNYSVKLGPMASKTVSVKSANLADGTTYPFTIHLNGTNIDASYQLTLSKDLLFTNNNSHIESGLLNTFNHRDDQYTILKMAAVQIAEPTTNQNFPLVLPGATSVTIPFSAQGDPAPPAPQISWTVDLLYQTTGGKGPFNEQKTFSTAPDAVQRETYSGMGGQLTISAGQGTASDMLMATITGVAIPDSDITSQLHGLYSTGATPNLMTGIAQQESSYMQFNTLTLFNRTDLWPNESFDGGSHIGLMMMPVSMLYAWDWLSNTQGGVQLFRQKLSRAQSFGTKIVKAHPGLPTLSSLQVEQMAVLLYGPYASSNLGMQYYVPQCVGGTGPACTGGMWTWVVNSAGNPNGVNYVTSVYSKVQ